MINSIVSNLSNRTIHKQVLVLAIPMVLSNITVPLLGMVDAAVIGHLEQAWYLGGVALGSIMISVSFWLLGFLRMATTGLSAQAFGSNNKEQLTIVFAQGIIMALGFSAIFLLLHSWLGTWIFDVSDASEQVKYYGQQYFTIRAWSAPAALANYVLLGWLLGTQNAKAPMWMVIAANVTNIILDLLFVVVFDWKVQGAAFASLIADYSSLLIGGYFVYRSWNKSQLPPLLKVIRSKTSQLTNGLGRFVKLNRDIFLRSLCLQSAFAFMTFQGASFGDDIVAANAVLMSFLMIISYGMDGFAYAMEAMVGKAVGAKNKEELAGSIVGTFFWCLIICSGLTLIFFLFGSNLIATITSIEVVQLTAFDYLPWLIVMPLCSMWCFLFDGIFIGATKGKEMRNGMVVATATFFIVFLLLKSFDNHALWAAMLSFMLMRGVTLGVVFIKQWKSGTFISNGLVSNTK